MVIANQVTKQDGGFITEYRGLKSDAMPITASVGDIFIYEDQGDTIFKFTENGWVRIVEGEGGGGKASAVVHLTVTKTDTYVDMSIDEIADLIKNDVDVRLVIINDLNDGFTYDFYDFSQLKSDNEFGLSVCFARSGIVGGRAYLSFAGGFVEDGNDKWDIASIPIPETE